jgi:multimeric flavodoxin WrbA
MSGNIVILKGSPRKKGNSSVLADRAAQGARDAGASVKCFELHELQLHPCDGCDACRSAGGCVISDDMEIIYGELAKADGVIFASPIYWFTYSAQLKVCIDRLYALWNSDHDSFKGKRFGIILTYGDEDLYTSGAINAMHTFESMSRFLGSKITGWVHGSVGDIGDALKDPGLMGKAYQLGKTIVQPVA